MKTITRILLFGLLFVIPFGTVFSALDYPIGEWETILTSNPDDVIGQKIKNSDDVLRDWTEAVAEWIWDAAWSEKIYYSEIKNTAEAWTEFIRTWKWIVNWTLSVAWLAALIYILTHWFIALTAWWDEEKLKKWMAWIKYGLIAVFWIAVAWFILSLIFWLIKLLVA